MKRSIIIVLSLILLSRSLLSCSNVSDRSENRRNRNSRDDTEYNDDSDSWYDDDEVSAYHDDYDDWDPNNIEAESGVYGVYSISDIDQLNGMFILSSDQRSLLDCNNKYSKFSPFVALYEIGYTNNVPICRELFSVEPIQIHSGERLVLVGDGWTNLSSASRDSSTIKYKNAVFMGYGNRYSGITNKTLDTGGIDLNQIQSINGIDLSGLGGEIDNYNYALSDTFLRFEETYFGFCLLTENYQELINVDYFEGTQHISEDISMCNSYFSVPYHGFDGELPVITTNDGYFIIDTSSLSSGYLYVINGVLIEIPE